MKIDRLQLLGLKELAIKEITRVKRIWIQSLLPPIITTSLYFLIFGHFMGDRIGDMQGLSYKQYLVPGLVMMAVIQNAYANVSSSFFGAKFGRSIEELMVSPLRPGYIVLGYTLGGIFRAVLVSIIILLAASFFVDFHVHHLFVMIGVTLVTAWLFSIAGFLNGLFARKFDDVTLIPTFILTPLTYLGGSFYSINWLPKVWQKISLFNPILYAINTFRYSVLGVSDISVAHALMMISAVTLLLSIVAVKLLAKGVGTRN